MYYKMLKQTRNINKNILISTFLCCLWLLLLLFWMFYVYKPKCLLAKKHSVKIDKVMNVLSLPYARTWIIAYAKRQCIINCLRQA